MHKICTHTNTFVCVVVLLLFFFVVPEVVANALAILGLSDVRAGVRRLLHAAFIH